MTSKSELMMNSKKKYARNFPCLIRKIFLPVLLPLVDDLQQKNMHT